MIYKGDRKKTDATGCVARSAVSGTVLARCLLLVLVNGVPKALVLAGHQRFQHSYVFDVLPATLFRINKVDGSNPVLMAQVSLRDAARLHPETNEQP